MMADLIPFALRVMAVLHAGAGFFFSLYHYYPSALSESFGACFLYWLAGRLERGSK
jgi:hypothetical protein